MSSSSGSKEYFNGLEKLEDGRYLTYYSTDYHERASYLAEMAEKGYKFLQEFFQTNVEIPLMVLNKDDWEKRSELPYGLINAYNNCLHFPADTENLPLVDTMQPIFDSSPEHLQQKLIHMVGEETPFKKGFHIFFDSKIVHELTHVCLKNRGIRFGLNWFTEFFCDYTNYAFLKRYEEEYRHLLKLLELIPHIVYEGGLSYAKYTRSEDFDRLYHKVGVKNVSWFYCRGLLGVFDLYKVQGEGFISDVISAYGPSNDILVERLSSVNNTLGPWFKECLTKNP